MEYYIISFFISLIIIIFVYEKKEEVDENNNVQQKIFTLNNFMLFIVIYIVTTIFAFYTKSIKYNSFIPGFITDIVKVPDTPKDNVFIDDVDPKTISKINDNIDIGFMPPQLEAINEIPDPDVKVD